MDLIVHIQLIFLCVVNTIFAFGGIVSNTLVIVSFWKSSQLQKKLCYFMIMVLSCFDLASVVTNHPGALLYLISWLADDYGSLSNIKIYIHVASLFLGSSMHALLMMSIEQYLGAYYPIFHRTSVTRRKLLFVLAISLIPHAILNAISINDLVISQVFHVIVFIITTLPLFVFVNMKLFIISRNTRRRNAISPEKRLTLSLKNISTCLLAVACIPLLFIPTSVYIVFNIGRDENEWDFNARLSYIWACTVSTARCTFHSLIFFWKNNVLRTEGKNILKAMKNRLIGSYP